MAFIQCDFKSQVLALSCSMNVILPEDRAGPHPVLWLLHGLSDDHTTWMRRTALERHVEGRGLAVVMPAVNRSFYWDMARGLNWGTFVRDELPEIASRLFPLSGLREHHFVAGFSMGGYGAFLAALTHPDRYAAAASLSGALDNERRLEVMREEEPDRIPEWENVFGNLDDVPNHPANIQTLLRRHAAAGTDLPALFACCGTSDFLYPDNLSFKQAAEDCGVDLTYEEAPGDHNWEFCDKWIVRVLDWLPLPKDST